MQSPEYIKCREALQGLRKKSADDCYIRHPHPAEGPQYATYQFEREFVDDTVSIVQLVDKVLRGTSYGFEFLKVNSVRGADEFWTRCVRP